MKRKTEILVVDDEEELRFSISVVLEEAGYSVSMAENGHVALEKIIDFPSKYDLMLLDVQMPIINGLELIDALKEKEIEIPTLIMTGFGDHELLLDILRKGCEDYLDKPFDGFELLERIESFLTKRNKNNALVEVEKAKIKSALMANFSHELRTPTHGLIGIAELLASNDLTCEQREDFIKDLHNCCDSLLTTVNRIIDLSVLESGRLTVKKSRCHLNRLMEDVLCSVRQELHKHGKPSLDIRLFPPLDEFAACSPIETFPDVISQVLKLLGENSLRFTDEGYVEFFCEVDHKTQFIHFHVKDSGHGIPREHQDTLFESYFRSDDAIPKVFHGSGLSLASAKKLVDLVKGKIWFESSEGEGSTFYFEVPYEISIEEIA